MGNDNQITVVNGDWWSMVNTGALVAVDDSEFMVINGGEWWLMENTMLWSKLPFK